MEAMYCHNCGQQIPDTSKFCRKCGARQQIEQPPPMQPIESPEVPPTINPSAKRSTVGVKIKTISIIVVLCFCGFLTVSFINGQRAAFVNGQRKVRVMTGNRVVCVKCGKVLEDNTKVITVKERDRDSYKVARKRSLCEKCGNELIEVTTGERYICKICNKTVKENLKTIQVKRKDASKHRIQIVKIESCPKCQQEKFDADMKRLQDVLEHQEKERRKHP